MQWIQIIIFVLLLSGFFTLFDIRFTDLLNLLAVGKKSTLNDDIDVPVSYTHLTLPTKA